MEDRTKIILAVEIELDDVPGTFHTVQSAMDSVQAILNNSIPHYNPKVQKEAVAQIAMCEIHQYVLKANRAYLLSPIEGCKSCDELVKAYEEAYGVKDTPRTPAS